MPKPRVAAEVADDKFYTLYHTIVVPASFSWRPSARQPPPAPGERCRSGLNTLLDSSHLEYHMLGHG